MSNFSFCRTILASSPSFSRTERWSSTRGTDFTTALAFPSLGAILRTIESAPLSSLLPAGAMRALRSGEQSGDLPSGSGAGDVHVSDPRSLPRANESGAGAGAPDAGSGEYPRGGGVLRLAQPRLPAVREDLRLGDARRAVPRRRNADGGGERNGRREAVRRPQQPSAAAVRARLRNAHHESEVLRRLSALLRPEDAAHHQSAGATRGCLRRRRARRSARWSRTRRSTT